MDDIKLEDEKDLRKKVRDLAEGLILVLQGNLLMDPAVVIINEIVEMAGIKATYGQQGKQAWWEDDTEEGSEIVKAQALMADVRKCWPQGEFEREAGMVEAMVWKHREANLVVKT